jgi:uncharacterized membrane protein (UPF0127 family)
MTPLKRLLAALIILISAALPLNAQVASFERGELTIISGEEPHHFTIELAVTPAQQEQGLMFRSTMAPDAGMLFLYETPRILTMWMKNTILPLDMVFFGADGRIMHLVKRAVPGSLSIISSGEPARAVLELNGGTIERLHLKLGDRIDYPGFPRN